MRSRPLLALGTLTAVAVFASSCGDSTSPERAGPPSDVRVSAGDKQTGSAGSVLAGPIAAKVTDAKGRAVPNALVNFQPMPGAGSVNPISAHTNGAGIATSAWTLPTVAGSPAFVRAVVIDTLTGELVDSVSFEATVVGGPPVVMSPDYFYPSISPTGSSVGPMTVVLFDRYGNRSAGVTVTWTVMAGGGTVSSPTIVTDANGIASVSLTLGNTPGTNTVRASVGTLSAVFSVEGRTAGLATSLSTMFYPGSAPLGTTLPLDVALADGFGHPVIGATIAWTVVAGGGTLGAATSITNGNGIATVPFTLGTGTALNTVQAKTGALTATFNIEGRRVAQHLTTLGGEAFGIGRTSGGRFFVAEIHSSVVETFLQSAPQTKQRIVTGGTPVIVAIDDADAFAYVSNMGGWMDIIDIGTNTVVKQVAVPNAHALALAPGGARAYVTSTTGWVYAVSTVSRQIVDSVAVPYGPWGIAFKSNATDSLMYVTSRDGGTVTEVNTKTMTVLRTFTVGGRPHGLVISADGRTLYAADNADYKVKAIDIASGSVIGALVVVGAFGIAISPDGRTLFVTTDWGTAAVIDAATLALTKSYDTPSKGRQIIVTPDGNTAYAANEGGWVDIIPR